MEMALDQAVWALEEGYCLWVGAGLTRQLASGHTGVPLWDELTRELESKAGLKRGDKEDFPHRLDECIRVLGESEFRSFLRNRYYTEFCCALLSQAATLVDSDDFVPDGVRAVAALGQLANPIISFNIEPLSSLLLARPGGPVRILFHEPQGKPSYTWREPGGRFQRLAYHPHGLVTHDAVMTTTQYEANRQTLAFGLAVHASFANTLAIVGMSLDDEYLRRHIEQFRSSIGPIYWFNSQFSDELLSWSEAHRITTVCSPWVDFWQRWSALPISLDPGDLAAAWYLAVSEAVEEAEGGTLGSLERSLGEMSPTESSRSLSSLAAYLAQAGTVAGEPGKGRLVGGKEPRAIAQALSVRMANADFPLPIIGKSYNPGLP